jgi:hypothetical protein
MIGAGVMKRTFAITAAVLLASICTGCPSFKEFISGNTARQESDRNDAGYQHSPYPGAGASAEELRSWQEQEYLADQQDKKMF